MRTRARTRGAVAIVAIAPRPAPTAPCAPSAPPASMGAASSATLGTSTRKRWPWCCCSPGRVQVYRQRMPIAETVHAELRERFGLRRFHRRGLSAVRAEFGLYCIAFNLKKALRDTAVLVVVLSSLAARKGTAGPQPQSYVLSIHIVSLSQTE